MKISVIGGGTSGGIAAGHWSRFMPEVEVEWIFSPDIPPVSVGEGTTVALPHALELYFDFDYTDMIALGGTPKLGLLKTGWGDGKVFTNPFGASNMGMHINARKLHDWMEQKLSNRVTIKRETVKSHDDIDADYIIDCTGYPKGDDDKLEFCKGVPVNAVYVTQCYWDRPEFMWSLTFARKHGWVFGIPLQNRCAIGYMYNSDITSLDEVKEDVKSVFEERGLTPSDDTLTMSFKNYYRKKNYTSRGYYNGNASFFQEPLEATSLDTSVLINTMAWRVMHEGTSVSQANNWYENHLLGNEALIAMHYLAGSEFDSPFWDYAQNRAEQFISQKAIQIPSLRSIISTIKDSPSHPPYDVQCGVWNARIWQKQLKSLGVFDKVVDIFGGRSV